MTQRDELEELRALLNAPVAERVDELESHYHRRAADVEAVSNVVAEAVRLRTDRDDDLSEALLPTIESSLKESVRRNRQIFVDAVYPALGPAIRKAIAATMRSMVQSMNRAIEQRYSLQGLKWRVEAMRSGRSFAEVVFLHTLVYRVEQVFLIHGETGLLLQHLVAEDVEAPNADMVSGMLTAIQDFVRDSFGGEGGASLENIRVGELTVWIERGPAAVIAVVIRGEAPESLREDLSSALEHIHLRVGDALEDFQGDPAPFEAVRPDLESCLQSRQRETSAKPGPVLWIVALVVTAALAWVVTTRVQEARRWRALMDALRTQPGIVVTGSHDEADVRVIEGLRDPLARDPGEVLAESPVERSRVRFALRPYADLHPDFVLHRARNTLRPEEGVRLSVEGTRLVVEGRASHPWLERARLIGPTVPGVESVDTTDAVDADLEELNRAARKVNEQQLRFVVGSSELVGGQERTMRAIADQLQAIHDRGRVTGGDFVVRVVGHTDASGDEEKNRTLSRERAESVARALAARGLRIPVETEGMGSSQPLVEGDSDAAKEANRRVEFEVRARGDGA